MNRAGIFPIPVTALNRSLHTQHSTSSDSDSDSDLNSAIPMPKVEVHTTGER